MTDVALWVEASQSHIPVSPQDEDGDEAGALQQREPWRDAGLRATRRWRGRGGGRATASSVQFDRQLDNVAMWLEAWNNQTKCAVLEAILRYSTYTQFQLLCTVLLPALPRVVTDTHHADQPSSVQSAPITVGRGPEERLSRLHVDTFQRLNSSYPPAGRDVTRLPSLPCIDTTADWSHTSRQGQVLSEYKYTCGTSESIATSRPPAASTVVQTESSTLDAVSRFLEMPVRRHIQNQHSPRRRQPPDDYFKSASRQTDGSAHGISTANVAKTRIRLTVRDRKLPEEGNMLVTWYDSWNSMQKNEFLHKLLVKLDGKQQRFLSNCLSLRQHRDFLTQLPFNLALHVLSFLSPRDLVTVSQVSRAWRTLASHNQLWETKCRQVRLQVPVSACPVWKRVFRDNHHLRLNWHKGVCRMTEFKGHKRSVLTVALDGDRLASGSADTTVHVWNIRTGKRVQVLKGHSKGVWCLQFFTRHLLLSGSFDCTIRVWNLRTGALSRTLLGHAGPVWSLARHANLLVSGSNDKTAKMWDISRCLLLDTLVGHKATVFATDVNETGTVIFTGSADRTVRLWRRDTGQCQRRICVSGASGILSLSYSHGYFACSHGSSICLYQGTELINTFKEHKKRVETVKLRVDPDSGKGVMVSADQDGLCKYWNITRSDSIRTLRGHAEAVNCVDFNELRIATACRDQKIRLWDFTV